MSVVPVELGQARKSALTIWGVLKPHPTRRGFWICAADSFPYDLEPIGRRQLEAMQIVQPTYWRRGGHPGIAYWRSFTRMRVI